MDYTPEHVAAAALSRVFATGGALDASLQGVPAVELWERLRSGHRDLAPWLARAADTSPERDLERARETGVRFVIPGDDEFPAQLPSAIRAAVAAGAVGLPPWGLWLRGSGHLAELLAQAVTITGARACSAYGDHVAGELGVTAAEHGLTVVTGLGYGIDASATRGALAVSGATVAVMASGVDVVYPRGNAALFDRVLDGGLVVSELPLGASPTRLRHLARARLLATLSGRTVVVEAAERSSALHIARWAKRAGRSVLAVPGPITSMTAAGPHKLVRAGEATLLASLEQITEAATA